MLATPLSPASRYLQQNLGEHHPVVFSFADAPVRDQAAGDGSSMALLPMMLSMMRSTISGTSQSARRPSTVSPEKASAWTSAPA